MPHTPGPWNVDETNALGAYGVWDGHSDQICSMLTESFELTDGINRRNERDANAKLIAAAPDLLKACEYAFSIASTMPTPKLGEWNWPHVASELKNALDKATS